MIAEISNSGLTERDFATLGNIFSKYPLVKSVYLFGSRAKGNYRQGSDIDLAIMNDGLTPDTIRKIHADLEESSLPYRVDLLHYPSLTHQELKAHIDRVGISFYSINI